MRIFEQIKSNRGHLCDNDCINMIANEYTMANVSMAATLIFNTFPGYDTTWVGLGLRKGQVILGTTAIRKRLQIE